MEHLKGLFEQAVNISKASAYDIIVKQRDELMAENAKLKEQLETGANQYAAVVVENMKLKEENKSLKEAAEGIINSWAKGTQGEIEEYKTHYDKNIGNINYWTPAGAIVESEAIAKLRETLNNLKP